MHQPTIDVYEREAGGYATRRGVQREERVRAFAAALPAAELPLALSDVHHVLEVGGRFDLTVFASADGGAGPTVEEVSTSESVYVLPSTSGLNARVSLEELVGHLRAAADGPGDGTR